MAKKNFVLDTSVYLTDADSIFKFGNHDIFIPLKVLEEIDKHKKRQDMVGINARKIIRTLDDLRSKGNLQKGIRLDKGKGIVKVMSYETLKESIFPPDLDIRIPDHVIIATAHAVRGEFPKRKTIVVARDINMRVICDSIGIECPVETRTIDGNDIEVKLLPNLTPEDTLGQPCIAFVDLGRPWTNNKGERKQYWDSKFIKKWAEGEKIDISGGEDEIPF